MREKGETFLPCIPSFCSKVPALIQANTLKTLTVESGQWGERPPLETEQDKSGPCHQGTKLCGVG